MKKDALLSHFILLSYNNCITVYIVPFETIDQDNNIVVHNLLWPHDVISEVLMFKLKFFPLD